MGVGFEMDTIVYGNVHGAALLADIARPTGGAGLPVVLSIHGGRWYFGTRKDTGAIDVRQWAGFGFFAMSIDYRLVTCTPAPAPYQDVLCAIRWVHANAQKYGLDRNRIFLLGMSAGGHMASLAATLGEGKFPKAGGWDEYPSTFRAAICVSGTYDLVSLDWGAGWAPPGEPFPDAREYGSRSATWRPAMRRSLSSTRTMTRPSRSSRFCAWWRRWRRPVPRTSSCATPIAATCSSPTR